MRDSADDPTVYTHAEWRVRPGREAEFIAAWRRLAAVFAALPARPLWGTLLQSEQEPSLFYSFGPWASAADVAAMRADPRAQETLAALAALCERATPGPYRRVVHVDLRAPAG